jgi:DNA-binding IclR family transcriptional regulator
MLWMLNLSGRPAQVAERAGLPFESVRQGARTLIEHGLLADGEEAG